MEKFYWDLLGKAEFPSLGGDIKCGCVVIGGGITGVLTAYLLGKRGIDTVLIEKGTLGCGKTLGTTAKATVCHGLTYSRIRRIRGAEGAGQYAEGNLAGLGLLRDLLLCGGLGEECDGRSADFCLYSLYGERHIEEEYRAMAEAAVPCHIFKGRNGAFELPFAPASGILLTDQLTFHPVKFLRAMGRVCRGIGVRIFEGTAAESIGHTASAHTVKTADGHLIHAAKVISAANFPLESANRFGAIKLYRQTTYAAVFDGAPSLSRMYFGIDGGYAYRSHGDHLIVSGESHRTSPVPNAADKLQHQATELFGDLVPVAAWSNNDSCTHDGIPFVGKVRDGMFLAAGFGGWGMTNSASAAILLSSLAAGESPPFGSIFAPSRNFLKGGGESFLQHVGISASGMAKRLTVPALTADKILPGCAGIVSHNGSRVGAYRDPSGEIRFVSLKCPHLGCSLEWNGAACTWDCPCHGSRFAPDGTCISDPSNKGISL